MKSSLIRNTIVFVAALTVGLPAAKAVPALDRDVVIQVSEPFGPGTTVVSGLNNEVDTFGTEHVSITGTSDKKLPGDIPGTHWMALVDADGTTVSDVLRLVVGESAGNDPSSVAFDMWSDGADDFAAMVLALPTGYDTLIENGGLQSVGP